MWFAPTVHDVAAGLPEKRDQSWYRAPSGELRFVYEWCDDGITVRTGVDSWLPISSLLGWELYMEDQYVECKRWAKENGWKWKDE